MQRALKLHVTVGKDHVVKLPSEFPEGPAELIIIADERATAPVVPNRGQGMDAERFARGEIVIADDFDAALPSDVQRYFDGDDDERG